MSDFDLLVRDALDPQVPLRLDRRPAWDDVLARAGVTHSTNGETVAIVARRRRRRRRLVLALAVVVVGVLVGGSALAALGHDPFGGLTSWLRGNPGKPAPAAEQAGFAARNDASYAVFPKDTKLRLLLRDSVGGKTFSLLGFRSRSALCLRLVRRDLPAGPGVNQCVTLRELRHSAAPALVASEASFRFGEPEVTVDGIVGFADETVKALELHRRRGTQQAVRVADNVFVALRARPSKAVRRHADPIVQVRALTRGGRRVAVPFVANDLGVLENAPRRGPSYLGQQRVTAGELPGPSAAVTTPPAGKIGWVTRRESRGRRFVNRGLAPLFGKVVFARTVQPDPESPFRLGIALTSGPPRAVVSAARTGRRTWLRPNRLTLCFTELVPLRGRRTGDIYCTQGSEEALLPPGWPLLIGDVQNDQVTRVSGIAADGVAAIDLFLASGRVVSAAMRDNAYTVEAPTTQFPAKLVAYDAKHRPVWVWVPQALAPAKVIPCPPAAVPGAVSAPAPEPYERLDLATGEINGHAIFGRSPRKVEAALGRPDFVQSGHDLGQRFTAFFFGGRRRQPIGGQFGWTDAALVVGFGWRQHRLRANSLSYEGPALVDAQLGHVLRLQPAELQRKIAAAYGSTYRLVVAYGSEPGGLGCGASFEARKGRLELSFGLRPWLSRRPFLILRRPS